MSPSHYFFEVGIVVKAVNKVSQYLMAVGILVLRERGRERGRERKREGGREGGGEGGRE